MEQQLILHKWYSIKETCEILGVSRNTLRTRTTEGKIICHFRRRGDKMFSPLYRGSEILKYQKNSLL